MKNLSIKQKLIIAIIAAVLIPTAIVGWISQQQAHDVVAERLNQIELPTASMEIRAIIEQEVSGLQNAAHQFALSPFTQQQLSSTDIATRNTLLTQALQQLKAQYQLTDASIANRQTGDYWNQNGFLRRLNHQQDGWFFKFRDSKQTQSLSIFQESNGDTKLFINYQQPNGLALAGLSKSIDEMVQFIHQFKIEQTGFAFLADAQGKVQIHPDRQMMGKARLAQIYSPQIAEQLLQTKDFNLIHTTINGQATILVSSYIPNMDWYVLLQVPLDETFASLNQARNQMVITTVGIAAICLILAIWFASHLTQPMTRLADIFQDLGQGDGDLSQRLEIKGQDEIAQLAQGFNQFIEKIHDSVKAVAQTGAELQQAAQMLNQQAEATLENSHDQRDRTLQVVTAINQMGATVNEIANNAAQAAKTAEHAEQQGIEGQNLVNQSRANSNQLADDIQQVSHVISSLAENTQAIGSILDVIRGISEQTNLLALNAAIEAARAGEQGRGFAVVADEVRSLASRTANSTDEIQTMINRLQIEAQNAVQAMQHSQLLTVDGVDAADQTSQALDQIAEQITSISDMNNQVATATEEQTAVVNDININIDGINNATLRNNDYAENLLNSSQQLRMLSEQLERMVSTFKL
ncbi:Methyl-accepting chemotaxis protein McpH [Vibrio stylophorae]|uniref:Methyl-accepting chemotaxis protein McpH n=1 Tax=Vibrio stylophorae TaxID=659351 RepID=A0ABM8ZVW1_9VIBR|nr:methyl-accepting chemotaxis protein [Vibrio stylophorae]CAH0534427.1 Methyl-accepting chemotaxis protein McpH [Vibrio stylophorae]